LPLTPEFEAFEPLEGGRCRLDGLS